MKSQPEYNLQVAVCTWLKVQHPDVDFLSDTVASIKLTFPQQSRNKKIQKEEFKTPDLLILEPNKNFKGLFIELKVVTPFKRNGELKKDDHLEAQYKTIKKLNLKGYRALFCWSFEMTVSVINEYLKDRL